MFQLRFQSSLILRSNKAESDCGLLQHFIILIAALDVDSFERLGLHIFLLPTKIGWLVKRILRPDEGRISTTLLLLNELKQLA